MSKAPQKIARNVGGHLQEKPGQLALGIAPGKEVYKQMNKGDKALEREIGNKAILARKAMHLRDVAHNDMHGGNVFYDPKTGKLTLIDMGLAQISPKAALVEAMGGILGQDYQVGNLLKRADASLKDKLKENVGKVNDKLKAKGYDVRRLPEIRSPQRVLDNYFGKMTDDEARQYIKEIYDGI